MNYFGELSFEVQDAYEELYVTLVESARNGTLSEMTADELKDFRDALNEAINEMINIARYCRYAAGDAQCAIENLQSEIGDVEDRIYELEQEASEEEPKQDENWDLAMWSKGG